MKHFLLSLLIISLTSCLLPNKSLKNKDIRQLELVYDSTQLIIPGNEIKIGIKAYGYAHETINTVGLLDGPVWWDNYEVVAHGAKFENGKIIIPKDYDPVKQNTIYVTATSKHQPNLETVLKLKVNHLTSLQAFTSGEYDAAPGGKVQVDLVATYDNGMQISSLDYPGCPDKFENLLVFTEGGYYRKNYLYIDSDPFKIWDHQCKMIIASRKYPHISDTIIINLDYVKDYLLVFEEFDGTDGFDGFDGTDGSFGSDGDHGDDGDHGEHGDHGDDLRVSIESIDDSVFSELVYIEVYNYSQDKTYPFLINPYGGSLSIRTIGGSGGDGGEGGDGGDGSNGKDGDVQIVKEKINDSTEVERKVIAPGEDGGHGGDGGFGGHGGDGGDGGYVEVFYVDKAYYSLDILKIQSIGGYGGYGGQGGKPGEGGKGGDGEPDGLDGERGQCGLYGEDGYDGRPGEIIFHHVRADSN